MRLSKIAFLHPAWITGWFLLPFVIFFVADGTTPEPGLHADIVWLVVLQLTTIVQIIWTWSFYVQAVESLHRDRASMRSMNLSFGLTAILMCVFSFGWFAPSWMRVDGFIPVGTTLENVARMIVTFMLLLFFVSCFRCFWAAATALKEAERQRGFPVLGEGKTLLLLFYLPIGVWFLRPRLLAVMNRR